MRTIQEHTGRDRCSGSINPPVAPPEPGEHLITDRAGAGREVVDADAFAEERHEIAALELSRHLCDIDRDQVHRDPAREWTTYARDYRFCTGARVACARGAEISVRIADRHDGE